MWYNIYTKLRKEFLHMNTINYYLKKLNAKSTDYGNLGDACELAVREFLTGKEQAKVKSQGTARKKQTAEFVSRVTAANYQALQGSSCLHR